MFLAKAIYVVAAHSIADYRVDPIDVVFEDVGRRGGGSIPAAVTFASIPLSTLDVLQGND